MFLLYEISYLLCIIQQFRFSACFFFLSNMILSVQCPTINNFRHIVLVWDMLFYCTLSNNLYFLLYIVQQSIFSAFFFCIEYTVSNNFDFLYVFHESDMLPYCTVPTKKSFGICLPCNGYATLLYNAQQFRFWKRNPIHVKDTHTNLMPHAIVSQKIINVKKSHDQFYDRRMRIICI